MMNDECEMGQSIREERRRGNSPDQQAILRLVGKTEEKRGVEVEMG